MYPFHTVLHSADIFVEFYVVDVRTLPSGRALVQLTVLVDPDSPTFIYMGLFRRLNDCMEQPQLRRLAEDLGSTADLNRVISFSVLVLPVGGIAP